MPTPTQSVEEAPVRVYVCSGCNKVHICVGCVEISVNLATFLQLHEKMSALLDTRKPDTSTADPKIQKKDKLH